MTRIEKGFKGAKLVGVNATPTNLKSYAVTVAASATSGTATVGSGATIVGIYPTSNQDQFVDNVAISGTTLTVTLAAAATADNKFKVTVLE